MTLSSKRWLGDLDRISFGGDAETNSDEEYPVSLDCRSHQGYLIDSDGCFVLSEMLSFTMGDWTLAL